MTGRLAFDILKIINNYFMNLNVKTTNLELSQSVEDYLRKKIGMLSKVVDLERDNVFIQAEIGRITEHHRTGVVFMAEINLHIGGRHYRAVADKEDLYAAIDIAKDELMAEVKKSKDRRKSLVRRGAQRIKNMLRFGRNSQ